MARKIKFGKIFVTVFLTALIWVWADLAEDEQLPLSDVVKVSVSTPADPNLWVALESEGRALRPSMTFKNVVLQGPAWRIADVERRINKGELLLDLFVGADQIGLNAPETRTIPALSFLKQNKEIRRLGLTVETCEPNTLTVQARRLSIADVPVQCVDASGNVVTPERIEPDRVKIPVPSGEIAVARVQLTPADQRQAREAPVPKRPFIDLADGTRKEALEAVRVKLPPAEDVLAQYSVSATLGICMSQNLQGNYRVELLKDPSIGPVVIRATTLAETAYIDQSFQMLLYIDDTDVKPGQEYTTRQVVFNFPDEYVRKGEIRLDQPPVSAQFRLVPITPPTATPPAGEP